MKKTIPLWILSLLLLIGMKASAATVEVRTHLWSGTKAMSEDWSSYVQMASSDFADVKADNYLAISYSTSESGYAQMALKTASSGWPLLTGTDFMKLNNSTTSEQTIKVTSEILAELQTTGLIVGGCNYTLTGIDLIKEVQTSDTEKGNPVTTIWKGKQPISWTGDKSWLTLNAHDFAKAKVGNKLRFNFNGLACGAQAHICSSQWTSITDAEAYISLSSSYFEYTLTEAMLKELQANGCIATGVGYTLTSIELIDPTQVPTIPCELDKSSIKCWEKNEQPKVTLRLQNLESKEQTLEITVKLRTDDYQDYNTYTTQVSIPSGETQDASVALNDLKPGFYHAVVIANYGEVSDFNIGYDPTSISSPVDAQSDFSEFWQKAKSDLAKVDPNFKLTKIEEKSTSKRNVYLVEMNSIDDGDGTPVTIRGYYAEPVAEGTYPVIITQNGYDSDATIPALNFCPNGDSNPGWIELNVSVRGQIINNREPNTNKYGDWFAYNFGKRDSYYYRGAYMDVVRSIDFIASREKAQQDNIFMMGGSQGGALTIAGAALDNRLNAIAPSIQFMGDFPDYFKVGAWPASVAKKQQEALGLSDEDMYKMLSYFDTKNLAPQITCPVITCMGLQDPVCPPHTNFAPYNNLTVADKLYTVNSELKHEMASTWYATCLDFFKKHMKGDVITNIWNDAPVIISWVTGTNHSELIAADKLGNAKAGDKIRVSYSNLGVATATGRILAGWTDFSGLKNVTFNGGSYYEYTLTDDMLSLIKEKKGLRISGNGYTLTSVDIIDPTKEYAIVSQYDEADIKAWEKGETPKLGMTITNNENIPVTTNYKVTILRDRVDDDTQTHSIYQSYQQEVALAAGETKHIDLNFDQLNEPGFYKLIANVNNNDVCSYTIGYDPTSIVSESTAPEDFWSYWDNAKKELAVVKPEISMEELTEKSSSKRKIYLVTMKSVSDIRGGTPVTIRGYYAEPVAEGKYPTLLHFQGTDGGSSTPWCMNANDNPNYCEFVLSVRGQMLNNREPNLADNIYGRNEKTGKTDYYSYEWGDTAKHYYRGAYLDCVRAVDFLKAQAKVDANNIFAAGGSQGGCFTYVAAGLTGAFKAIAPSITGHADFVDGMKIVNWPRANFIAAKDKLGMSDEQMNTFNAYYDVMNFAEHISCPCITSFSLQDTTDPPHTNIAPFNLLNHVAAADKAYIINPFLGHGTASNWGNVYMDFFKRYINDNPPTGIHSIQGNAQSANDPFYYTLMGIKTTSPSKGIYIHQGKKVVVE